MFPPPAKEPMSLTALIKQAYPGPEWAVFFEVSNATGFGARRRADAVALGVWPSRGQTLVGFEFKEDRRDWLREKNNPAKAEEIAQHCDQWFVVAGADGIVKIEELPESWGLLVASKGRTKLQTAKACTPFPDRDKTIMKRTFVAAMLRKVSETTVPRAELDRLVREGVALETTRLRDGRELKELREAVERLTKTHAAFKAATGVSLEDYRGTDKIVAAVDAVLNHGEYRGRLEASKRQLEYASGLMGEAIAAWPVAPLAEDGAS